jgi:hypothetical protein
MQMFQKRLGEKPPLFRLAVRHTVMGCTFGTMSKMAEALSCLRISVECYRFTDAANYSSEITMLSILRILNYAIRLC